MTLERNWAGNVEYRASRLSRPQSVDELQHLVAAANAAGRPVKALGTRHSFSPVADTDGELVSTVDLDGIVSIDRGEMTVTVEAGIRYGTLGSALHDSGLALANLPSLPHITVGGAVATGTHGSGTTNQCLSAAVAAIEYVGVTGELRRWERGTSRFDGAVIALGEIGVAAYIVLDVEPTFDVTQVVYRDLPFETALTQLDEIMGSAYSVSLFTDWQRDVFHQVWVKQRSSDRSTIERTRGWFGLTPAAGSVHMVESLSAESCTAQHGEPGPWHERLPHFRLECTPSVGEELQAEYFIDRVHGAEALRRVDAIAGELEPVLLVSEIRTVARDELWLSGAFGHDALAIHFTFANDQPSVMATLRRVESVLAEFEPRPHWGKLTAMAPGVVQARFPRYADFAALVDAERS